MATREHANRTLLAGALALLAAACSSLPGGRSGVEWSRELTVVGPRPAPPAGDPRREGDRRRAELAAALGGPGVIYLRGAGSTDDRFFQSDDFWYLSGVEVADAALAIVIGPDGRRVDELLWLPPKDPAWEVWNGVRLSAGPEAEAATGFARTASLPSGNPGDTWADVLGELGAGTLYTLDTPGFDVPGLAPAGSSVLRDALAAMRLVKSPYELTCLTNAIDITVAAQHQAWAVARPGMWESEAQAAIDGTYLKLGSERPGFNSICAGGANATALHYGDNTDRVEAGQLLLLDVGAKYRYYCADVTRTIPVDGVFTPRQREVYMLVLEAQRACERAVQQNFESGGAPMTIRDVHNVAVAFFEEHGVREHFKHGVGHWIGLDVHDVGGRAPIVENTLFTIEPGLYLADEGLGVRIEDDYLMGPDGLVKLSAGIPSDPDEVEALLASMR